MPGRSRWTVAAVAAAAVVVGTGAAVVLHRRRKPAPEPEPNPAPPVQRPVQHASVEPQEGYEERWARQRTEILSLCQREVDVTSYPQALTCALNAAYPEAAPWTNPVIWTPWMQEAAALVSHELRAATGGPGGSPQGWQVRAWLSGPRALAGCSSNTDHPALCAARQLYPWANWADPLPWQAELVEHLSRMAAP